MERQHKLVVDKIFWFLQETKETEVAKGWELTREFWGDRGLKLGAERRKPWQPQSLCLKSWKLPWWNKCLGNIWFWYCNGRCCISVFSCKIFFWGVAVRSDLVIISYGRKRQTAQSREERPFMNELSSLETESAFHSSLLLWCCRNVPYSFGAVPIITR